MTIDGQPARPHPGPSQPGNAMRWWDGGGSWTEHA